tara:strand:+ start:152 stop:454 length:303 start_codon:yes stop_codon:yes gene_type:complete
MISHCLIRSASNPSITSLSDWHVQQIRTLIPSWTHFDAFLKNFPELYDSLTPLEFDKLLTDIYPEVDEVEESEDLMVEDDDITLPYIQEMVAPRYKGTSY